MRYSNAHGKSIIEGQPGREERRKERRERQQERETERERRKNRVRVTMKLILFLNEPGEERRAKGK